MQKPAAPPNEAARIAVLHSLDILDTTPDERFDRLTRLAKYMFRVPISTVSLVDTDRQWFKSCDGLRTNQTLREVSFCGHAILDDDLFAIEDASADPRFSDNPLVTGDPRIRFYAGYPLTLHGNVRIGAFCLIDTKPRTLNEIECAMLRDLGRIAEREFEMLELAATDDLTGLWNRRGFEARALHSLKLCQRAQSRASLLSFDLDGFKRINDTFGHVEGDRAIAAFAAVLRASMRETDVLARFGGDEFVALAVSADAGSEARIIERVRLGVQRHNRQCSRGYELRFSVGLAQYDLSAQSSIAELIDAADRAMYANKRAGKAARMLEAQHAHESAEANV